MMKKRIYLWGFILNFFIAPVVVHAEAMDEKNMDVPSIDNRKVLSLSTEERAMVLFEMRQFLKSTKNIINGIVEDDMEAAARGARASGRSAQKGAPASLAKKLPATFKKLGFDTHRRFDELALDAEQLGDGEHALSQLNALLKNCVSCHSMYQISAP